MTIATPKIKKLNRWQSLNPSTLFKWSRKPNHVWVTVVPVYDDEFDLDLREHQDSELSSDLLAKVNQAKMKSLSSFTNITG
jgi:hypothetical protein